MNVQASNSVVFKVTPIVAKVAVESLSFPVVSIKGTFVCADYDYFVRNSDASIPLTSPPCHKLRLVHSEVEHSNFR